MDQHGITDPDLSKGEEQMQLPPGFRFHPTDEELITHYLFKKVMDASFDDGAIEEVNLNKCEPWELPWRTKMGDKEWYCFCVRDRKYPTGLRTNRATEAGYWKATGKDKEIYRGGKNLVGMKKTLVFYRGRAPKGEKSNWVMHEYRLEGKFSAYNLSRAAKEWVICRVLKKSWGGKKTTGMTRPLMDVAYSSKDKPASDTSDHVTCFSNVAEDRKGEEKQQNAAEYYFNNTNPMFQYSTANSLIPNYDVSAQSSFFMTSADANLSYNNFQGSGGGSFVQLLQNDAYGAQQSYCKTEKEMLSANVSQETGLTIDLNPEISSVPSAASMHFSADCLWSY